MSNDQTTQAPTKPDPADYLIWWTSRDHCDVLGEHPKWTTKPKVPSYIRDLYMDRCGRAGRGRLWAQKDMFEGSVPWDESRPMCRRAAVCGGIVIRREDLAAVSALPGFITDMSMNEVTPVRGVRRPHD